MGRTITLKTGSFRAKRNDLKVQVIPPTLMVAGAPIRFARVPDKRLPKGTIPMKATVYTLRYYLHPDAGLTIFSGYHRLL
jgi:hypothetical protein